MTRIRRGAALLIGAALAVICAAAALGGSGVGTITTIAGTGVAGFSGDGGQAALAQMDEPQGVAVDGQGNVYFTDFTSQRVRKITSSGTITTFAGYFSATITTGSTPVGDGGPATSAPLYYPVGLALDKQGNLYIAEYEEQRVRKVSPNGTITTFAGSGQVGIAGFSGDGGPATAARLRYPSAVAVDGQGSVYIADEGNHRVRKVSPGGTITTIAGSGVAGFSGDGGPATSANLNYPQGVAVDAQGNVYIADTSNYRVRKVSPGGTISTFAGGGSSLGDGGPATAAQLNAPKGVAVDGQGNVYIADTNDNRVREVSPGGTISTFAGGGSSLGDGGPATSAELGQPSAVAVDGQGNVYIADTDNHRVRKVGAALPAAIAPKVTLGGASTQVLPAQKGITVKVTTNKPCTLSATGSVKILGTRLVFSLTRVSMSLAAGTRTLTLRFTVAVQKRFRAALKAGQRARATIRVRVTDQQGHSTTSTRTIAVTRR